MEHVKTEASQKYPIEFIICGAKVEFLTRNDQQVMAFYGTAMRMNGNWEKVHLMNYINCSFIS